ncbi:MAG: hypothetical protein V3R96_00670 [Dehalococcoidales bacterium]
MLEPALGMVMEPELGLGQVPGPEQGPEQVLALGLELVLRKPPPTHPPVSPIQLGLVFLFFSFFLLVNFSVGCPGISSAISHHLLHFLLWDEVS